MADEPKKIVISGTNNKYQMNKLIKPRNANIEAKKRLESEKWNFDESYYAYFNQLMTQIVVNEFELKSTLLDIEGVKYINDCIVKEYLNDFKNKEYESIN